MTDIVYVVGSNSSDIDDAPLRWSLRSLEKHAANVGRVIVAGYPPKWLSREAIALPLRDKTKIKHYNMLFGIAEAVRQCRLDRPFLFSSDDHYLLPAYDQNRNMTRHNMDAWPRYFRGWLCKSYGHGSPNRLPTQYEQSLALTYGILSSEGLSTRLATQHSNMWVAPEDLEKAVELARAYAVRSGQGPEPFCLVNAFYEKRCAEAGVVPEYTRFRDDWKVFNLKDCLKKVASRAPCFTTCQASERNADVQQWMNETYAPSRWENS